MTEIAEPVERAQARTPMLFGRFRTWLAMVAFVTILAGVLFGYDQGVIAGALGGMTASFDLSTTMQEVVTSLVTLGALVGALLGGGLADRFGRTRTLVIAGVLFAFGALGESVAQSTGVETARFLLFAVMCVIAFVWIMAKVPETKGKSLEEIQDAWQEHDEGRSAPKDPTLQVDLA